MIVLSTSLRAGLYDWLRRRSSLRIRRWLKEQKWFMPLLHRAFSNDVYSSSYYQDVERLEKESTPHIADWIHSRLMPKTVIDVGCGPGHMMEALYQKGVIVFGVDISDSALKCVSQKGLHAVRFDLTDHTTALPGAAFDLVLSCEVAEHLEERFAKGFVKKLCAASKTVYLTAAEPDTGIGPGMMHFNEQHNSYWIELFREEGFELNSSLTENAREYYRSHNVISYLAKPMIFQCR